MLEGKRTESSRIGKDREKQLFFLILFLSFIAVLIFNMVTPMLSDDYAYAMEVAKASSPADLVRQEYHQYMTWNGRSVVHFLLRLFLFLPGPVFKIANSLAFVLLSLLMTRLIAPEKKTDCFTLLMVQMGLWLYAVDFSETILWEDGACNYLWGSMLILLFMTAERRLLRNAGSRKKESSRKTGVLLAGMFLLGLIAGWCNENTSGGCLLYLLLLAGWYAKENRVPAPFLAGMLGNAAGLAIMVLSPGGRIRASYAEEENYQGFLGILARVQKITLTIHEYFGVLLAVSAVCLILLYLQKQKRAYQKMLLYLLLFAATSYALAATRQTQARAFFGAGLFLLIAVITGIRAAMHGCSGENGLLLRAAGWSILAVLLLRFFFTYVENGTNLARIWRDETNRIAYIEEQKAEGKEEITVPQIHTDFYNSYSAIGKMEMTEDPEFWINVFYEEYYGIPKIHAIPYDDWAELTGESSRADS